MKGETPKLTHPRLLTDNATTEGKAQNARSCLMRTISRSAATVDLLLATEGRENAWRHDQRVAFLTGNLYMVRQERRHRRHGVCSWLVEGTAESM
jgi:hypothetical protein